MALTVNKIDSTNYINNNKKQQHISKTEQYGAFVGSTLGMTLAMGAVTKKNPLKLVTKLNHPKKIFNNLKKIELNGNDVIKIATGSIAGGLIAGLNLDPDNSKAKVEEAVTQLVGNYIIPSMFVTGGIKLNKALNKKFNYPPKTRIVKFMFGMASLITGVFTGNAISKKINEKIFNNQTDRKLKSSDWGMQVDNVCLVTSVANQGTQLAKNVSKVIPVANILPGYLTGIKKHHYEK